MRIVQGDREFAYGCIFCKTGYERALVREMSLKMNDMEFLVAQKKSRRRINRKMVEEIVIMFPGYVFFKTSGYFDTSIICKWPSVLRILTNGEGRWELTGDDYKFATWLFSHDGIIGFSKAMMVGDRLKILKGPLQGHEGQIIKVNRRFQNCLVMLEFEGRQFKIWLGYELLDNKVNI